MAAIGAGDFKYGMDRRRPRSSGAPGTLWECRNAHITRGGDVESMRAFVPAYTLPAGTFGLTQAAGQLYAFGSADLESSMPIGVRYVRCVPDRAFSIVTITGGTLAPGTNKVTQIQADSTNLLSNPVDWTVSHVATAKAVAAAITGGTHGYTATNLQNRITILAPAGDGAAANGRVVTVTVGGNVTATKTDFLGGITGSMVRVLHARAFLNKVYAIVEHNDGNIRHYLDGVRIDDWDNLGDANSTASTLAAYLASKIDADPAVTASASGSAVIVTAKTPGTPFTISAAAVNTGGSVETRATGTVTITGGSANPGVSTVSQIKAGTTELLNAPVNWITSNAQTALNVASEMAAGPAGQLGGYTSVATSEVITITSRDGKGAAANKRVVAVSTTGTVHATATDFFGGLTATVDNQTATVATPQPNVPGVEAAQATAQVMITGGSSNPGVNQVQQITANGAPLMAVAVDWVLSNEATAAAVAAAVNANAAQNGGYTAAQAAGVTTISAPPGTGATANGIIVAVETNGVSASATNFAGGVDAVTAVAQISTVTLGGTYDPTDRFTITINGTPYVGTGRASGTGTAAFVYRQRVYSPANTVLFYCRLNDAFNWVDPLPASGAGFIDFSVHMDGAERISGLSVYAGYAAVFLEKTAFIYDLAPDATTVSQVQLIPNTGTIAGLSAMQFGYDSLYLDSTGVRSIRSRDVSNTAITSDIGTVLDSFIQAWVAEAGIGAVRRAEAVIEPFDGRYWLAIGTRVFVLSFFTTAEISAWSYYDVGLAFASFTRIFNRLYARAGDVVYLYGGTSGAVYPEPDEAPITVLLPFAGAGSPDSPKELLSFGMACSGAWKVTFLVDPNDETREIAYGTALNTTYSGSIKSMVGRVALLAARLECSSGGHATLSSFSVGYKAVEN